MDTNEKRRQAETLETQARSLREQIEREVRTCHHNWGQTKYDPESYQEAVYSHLEAHGSDPTPIYNYVPAKRDRWSRTCLNCGLVQYTNKMAPANYVPDFK